MDGLRRVTFRVEHDCPLALLSRDVPAAELEAWSGHRVEVVTLRCPEAVRGQAAAALQEHLQPVRTFPTQDGFLAVWRPHVVPKTSISRILEAHDVLWLQPLRVAKGWEHYDAIAFGAGEQGALDALRADHPTQVVGRQDLGPEDLAGTLFRSLQPVLDAPTDRQAEAIVAAWEAGYYRSPRDATTADVAARLGIGRSAFEERLRGAENRIVSRIAAALRNR